MRWIVDGNNVYGRGQMVGGTTAALRQPASPNGWPSGAAPTTTR